MRGAARTLREFPTLLRVGFAEMVAYRAEIFIWFLAATLPAIMMLIWDRVAASGPVGRFDQMTFARYFASALVVRQLTSAWVVWSLTESIRTGELSPLLLKPTHPLVYCAAENLAAVPFRVLTLLPFVGLIAWWRPGSQALPAINVVPAILVSVVLGWAQHFLVQTSIASLSFFFAQSIGVYFAWYGFFALLSGFLIPIETLPDPWRFFVSMLPFRCIVGIPTEIASGLLEGAELLKALVLQLFWALAAAGVAILLWRTGIRRYEASGA